MDVVDEKGNILASFDDPEESSPCDDGSSGSGQDEAFEIPLTITVGESRDGSSRGVDAALPMEAERRDEESEVDVVIPVVEPAVVPTGDRSAENPVSGKVLTRDSQPRADGVSHSVEYRYIRTEYCTAASGCPEDAAIAEYEFTFHVTVPSGIIVNKATIGYFTSDGCCSPLVRSALHSTCHYGIALDSDHHFDVSWYTYGGENARLLLESAAMNFYTVTFHITGAMTETVDVKVWKSAEGEYCNYCDVSEVDGNDRRYIQFDRSKYVFCGCTGYDHASAGLDRRDGLDWLELLVTRDCTNHENKEVTVVVASQSEWIRIVYGGSVFGEHPLCTDQHDDTDEYFSAGTMVTLYPDRCEKHSRRRMIIGMSDCRKAGKELKGNELTAIGQYPHCRTYIYVECTSAYHVKIYYWYPFKSKPKLVANVYTFASQYSFTASKGGCKYKFAYWTKGSSPKRIEKRNITLNLRKGEIYAVAYYELRTYDLTVTLNPPGAGIVSLSKEGPYRKGDVVDINVTAYECYLISNGYDAVPSLTDTVKFNCGSISKSYSFVKKWFAVTTSVSGGCDCTVDVDGTNENGAVECGGSVTLTAVAGKCSRFTGWSTGETDETITIDDVKDEIDMVAYFEICTNTSGTDLVSDGNGLVTCGGSPVHGQRTC